jgi:hypothetical protein
MANRESQGLQISLILFVMVSVVLAVMTFVFYRSSQEANKTASAAQASAQSMVKSLGDENFKVQYLQHILGAVPLAEAPLASVRARIAGDATMTAIDAQYQLDMANYGDGLPPEKSNYRELPDYLTMALKNKNVENAGLAIEVARLSKKNDDTQRSEAQRTLVAQNGMDKAKDDLLKEQQDYANAREQLIKDQEETVRLAETSAGKLRNDIVAAESDKTEAQRERDEAKQTIETQQERIEMLVDEPFESPDGRIVFVNQRSRSVWIDLGRDDGLRRQTTFSVYDHEAMNVAPGRQEEGAVARKADLAKAKIEITRVDHPHLAEGRIVEDDPTNPIMTGDQIFSPAWKPGRRVQFALAGFMDLNDDRKSDRALIRSIINAGGGVVDAEVLDDGKMQGDLTGNTRYLVLGEPPLQRAVLNSFSQMKGDAATLGVQEIALNVLLDQMGYKSETRTLPLGRRRGGRLPEAEETPETNDEGFRERRPSRSAF